MYQKFFPILIFGYVLKLLISTAAGRFYFITVQGRHLFKETTFTVSTLPRAWLEPRANRMLVMKALRQITSMGRAVHSPSPKGLDETPQSGYYLGKFLCSLVPRKYSEALLEDAGTGFKEGRLNTVQFQGQAS